MIGSAYKKFAKEHNLRVADGVAYGELHGYVITLFEGAGWKKIIVATQINDFQKKDEFLKAFSDVDAKKTYRVSEINVNEKYIDITFKDTAGTMKKIYKFIDWFFPVLDSACAVKIGVCSECGYDCSGGGKWLLVDGVAYLYHSSCADGVISKMNEEDELSKQEDNTSYLKGFFGALLGALLGTLVWIVFYMLGYMSAVVGVLIGVLAQKWYDKFGGKKGKGKILIMVIVTILAVIIGTLGGEAGSMAVEIAKGNLPGFTYSDVIPLLVYVLLAEPEAMSIVTGNILSGILFAFLGIAGTLFRVGKEINYKRVIELK